MPAYNNTNYFTTSYQLGFNFKANIDPMVISGQTIITNTNTAPEFYGAFLESTPTCQISQTLTEIRTWFGASNGTVVRFSVFDSAPIEAGDYKITAHVRNLAGDIEIRTWKLISSVWVRQPYTVRSVVPISVAGVGLSVVAGKVVGSPIPVTVGQEIAVRFGLLIVPEENYFTFNRYAVEGIGFKSVPAGGFDYVNNA